MIEAVDHGIERRRDVQKVIRPGRDQPARFQYPRRLGGESVEIEPMQRLRHRNEIDRIGLETRIFSGANPVIDPLSGNGLGNLGSARIGRDHLGKVCSKASRRLTRARRTIPNAVAGRCNTGQIREQRGGIVRSVATIAARVAREVIGKVAIGQTKRSRRWVGNSVRRWILDPCPTGISAGKDHPPGQDPIIIATDVARSRHGMSRFRYVGTGQLADAGYGPTPGVSTKPGNDLFSDFCPSPEIPYTRSSTRLQRNIIMDYRYIEVRREGAIATVTFLRPEKANALNYAILAEIEQVALSFREDVETRVVIFTGAGKHFSAGFDLTDPNTEYEGPLVLKRRRNRIGARVISALHDIDQITIAAWNGAAMGGGACIPTALDFRVGAASCVMRYPEVDLGMNLMWQSLPLCVRLAGPARAKRLVVGGETIAAPTLLEWGILDDLVDDDQLMARARELATFYAAKPPVPAQMIKRSINRIAGALDQSVMDMDADQNLLTRGTQDMAEAVRAYLAGETPVFKGD